jgi:hypothetical protein
MSDNLGEKLEDLDQEQLEKRIDALTKDSKPTVITRIIEDIARLDSPIYRDSYVNRISAKTGISKVSLKRELLAMLQESRTVKKIWKDVCLVHPAYDFQMDFLSLGFRETVVENEEPVDQNFYITSRNGNIELIEGSKTWQSDDINVVFNVRDRMLLNVSDRWDKTSIEEFTKSDSIVFGGIYYQIKDILKIYIELQEETQYGLLAAWIVATYFHRLFHAFPFLFIYGKKQTGKTRLLDLLERLCFNAIKIKGVSVASLADTLDGIRGTFLNDQAEALSSPRMEEILGILADSYTVGGGKRRIVDISNKRRRILEFETYSPKAFASIKDIDSDIKDRCIQLTMVRSLKDYPYPEPYLPIWRIRRDSLYKLLLTKWERVRELYQEAGNGVSHRVRELWRPIETILTFEQVPQDEVDDIKDFFLRSMLDTQTELSELEQEIFDILRTLLAGEEDSILRVSDIVEHVEKWEDHAKTKKGFQTLVGTIINQLNLHSGQFRSGRGKSYRFNRSHIEEIFSRFHRTGCTGDTATQAAPNKDLQGVTAEIESYTGYIEGTPVATAVQPVQPIVLEVIPSKSLNNNGECNHATTVTTSTKTEKNEILDLSKAEVIGWSTE